MHLKYFEIHLNTVRKANMKKINDKCWRNVGKEEPSFIAGQGVKWLSHYRNQNSGFSKNEKQNFHIS